VTHVTSFFCAHAGDLNSNREKSSYAGSYAALATHICSAVTRGANIHTSLTNISMAEQRSFLRVDRTRADIPELNLPLPEDGPDADAIAASVLADDVDDVGDGGGDGDDGGGVDGDGAAAAAVSAGVDNHGDSASGDDDEEEEDEEARLLAAAKETIEKHK